MQDESTKKKGEKNNMGRHVIGCTRHVRITDAVTRLLASWSEPHSCLSLNWTVFAEYSWHVNFIGKTRGRSWLCSSYNKNIKMTCRLTFLFYFFKLKFTLIYLDCLLGVKGEPWLICPRLSAVLPFTLHVSTRFLGGSASNCPADPLMLLLITSSSSSHAGLLRFLSSSRKYITFSVLWLREY